MSVGRTCLRRALCLRSNSLSSSSSSTRTLCSCCHLLVPSEVEGIALPFGLGSRGGARAGCSSGSPHRTAPGIEGLG